jgi:hypothetical protein
MSAHQRRPRLRTRSATVKGLLVCCTLAYFFFEDNKSGTHRKLDIDIRNRAQDPRAESFLRQLPRNVLLIQPYHGLGNRLRAYACASALARKTGRKLVVVWIPDPHVRAPFSDLFDTSNITVVDFPLRDALLNVWSDAKTYDYNMRGRKDEIIKDRAFEPIYVRSAYVLQSEPIVTESDISAEINKLEPVEKVKFHINHMTSLIGAKEPLVGVHIRMNSDILTDVPGIQLVAPDDPASTSNMGPVKEERRRCYYDAFIPHLQKAINENPRTKFFVTSDNSAAVSALRSMFQERVLSNDRAELEKCEATARRESFCLQICLAEFFILGKETSSLILSEWSSASELILRLGNHGVPHTTGCAEKKVPWFGRRRHLT